MIYLQAHGWTRILVNRDARWAARIKRIPGGWIALGISIKR